MPSISNEWARVLFARLLGQPTRNDVKTATYVKTKPTKMDFSYENLFNVCPLLTDRTRQSYDAHGTLTKLISGLSFSRRMCPFYFIYFSMLNVCNILSRCIIWTITTNANENYIFLCLLKFSQWIFCPRQQWDHFRFYFILIR